MDGYDLFWATYGVLSFGLLGLAAYSTKESVNLIRRKREEFNDLKTQYNVDTKFQEFSDEKLFTDQEILSGAYGLDSKLKPEWESMREMVDCEVERRQNEKKSKEDLDFILFSI
jgi:hypothetical protein